MLFHRRQPLDHPALVEADVVNDVVHPEALEPLRIGDAILGREIIAHHPDAVLTRGIDDAPHRRFVSAAHDHDEAGAGLRHHLSLEVPAIHGLQVRHDWMVWKADVQRFDSAQKSAGKLL